MTATAELPYASCPQCGTPLRPDMPCAGCALELALLGVEDFEARHDDVTLILPEPQPGFEALAEWTLPRQLAGYELRRVVGRGGMGVVFDAHDPRLERRVAIKVLHGRAAASGRAQQFFQQEMRAIARLDHPHIVTVHHADKEEGVPFFVMEFVQGQDLARRVRDHGPLNPLEALSLLIPAAEALAAAHAIGIIHRDVKPSNILTTDDGGVKMADFGISRLIHEAGAEPLKKRQLLGTVDFMAPEQVTNPEAADERADVYGLGCTLFYLLTGHEPCFEFETRAEKLAVHANSALPDLKALRPGLPAEITALWLKMTAHDPAERFQSMPEALKASRDCEDTVSGAAARRRRRRLAMAAALASLAALGWGASALLPKVAVVLEQPRLALDISGAGILPAFQTMANETAGYSFTLAEPVEVKALAWFDHEADGISAPVRVGIWAEWDQHLVAEATVGPDAEAMPSTQENGRWLVRPLPQPVRLEAGGYVIGGLVHSQEKDPVLMLAAVETLLPGFEMGVSRRGGTAGRESFRLPQRVSPKQFRDRWFGPNFVASRVPDFQQRSWSALRLNGETDHVRLPTLRHGGDPPLCLEAIVRIDNEPATADATIVSLSTPGLAVLRFRLGCWETMISNGDPDPTAVLFEGRPDDLHRWLHVAAVWDAQGRPTLYVDGKPRHQAGIRSPRRAAYDRPRTTTPSAIGAQFLPGTLTVGKDMLRGLITEVRVSSEARYEGPFTPPRVEDHLPADAATEALYHFDSVSPALGDTVRDDSVHKHHGVLMSIPRAK